MLNLNRNTRLFFFQYIFQRDYTKDFELEEFVKQNLKKRTIIICTGAAISFLTKVQAPINEFYDKYYLGWLIRLVHKPKSYFPRIINSLNLIKYF